MKLTYSKTIYLYIAREAFFAFLVCFLFFFFIFFVNQLLLMAGEILSKRVPLYQVALLVLYSLPSIIAMSSPFACLTGTLMTIGRFTSDNEILVFLASGLSYRDIFMPAIIVGLIISVFSFFTNDILLPAGTVQFSRLYRRILFSTPALELESNSVKRFNETIVITGPVIGNNITDVLIMDRTSDGERRLIVAGEAGLEDSGGGRISINLNKAFVQSGKENLKKDYDYAFTESLKYIVSQEDMVQTVYSVGPREMSSVDVKKEIMIKQETQRERIQTELKRLSGEAFDLEDSLRKGNMSRTGYQSDTLRNSLNTVKDISNDRTLSLFRLEYYKKFSIPFGALSFVLVAVSIGLMANKSGQTVGFIIGICLAALYWSLLTIGQEFGTRLGVSPFWAMWFPNILFIVAGACLTFAKVFRR